MAIWVSSDWHCNPDQLKATVVQWIEDGKKGGHRLVGAGDLFNILPLGKRVWHQAASVAELAKLLNGYPFDYVTGNHDPYRTMNRLMVSYPNITVRRWLELPQGGRTYFVSHGHRWALDWSWLRWIAPWIVERMVDWAPGFWLWFCRRMGWLASSPTQEPSDRERQRINDLTRIIWGGASRHALKCNCCVILGHTHTTGRNETGVNREEGFLAYLADGGDLPDGTYIEITDDARLHFLSGSSCALPIEKFQERR